VVDPILIGAAFALGLLGGWALDRALARRRVDVQLREKREDLERREREVGERGGALKEAEERAVRREEALLKREEAVDQRSQALDRRHEEMGPKETTLAERARDIDRRDAELAALRRAALEEVAATRAETERLQADLRARLAQAADLPEAEARRELLSHLDHDLEGEKARRIVSSIEQAKAEASRRARDIVLTAIQRVAVDHGAEATATPIKIPNDDMKGRIIGRDGRNIRAFEAVTGCDVVVDETPGQVVISAFDPVRREVARIAMAELIEDGRIHPTRIEEVVADVQARMKDRLVELGHDALVESDVHDVHPDLVNLLGSLAFRTSYGQNVLRHSVEAAHLAGAMASELGLDARTARRAALFHDIGKAIDHRMEGSHSEVAAEMAKRLNEAPVIVNAIAASHDDLLQDSPYAVLAQVADAISAARPGARMDQVERYAKRMLDLEALAARFPGVDKAYAIQAGREVRVIVDAARVTDGAAPLLAHEIARAVESELTYPGEVKVTVVREVRAVDVAR
jgi:ribonuclease Y